MRLLLDTHTLLWALAEPERLSRRARRAVEDERNDVLVSAASVWEIAIKAGLGRLGPDGAAIERSLPEEIERHAFQPLQVQIRHALRVATLPAVHRDPFDRLLAAQAIVEGLHVVTADRELRAYGLRIVW